MEETIVVNWDVNVTSGSECLTLDYLECETVEEWEALDIERHCMNLWAKSDCTWEHYLAAKKYEKILAKEHYC